MSKRNIVFMAMLFAISAALAGCGGGGSVNIEDGNNPPVVTTGRKITGTVVSSATTKGVAGVVVRFSSSLSATTAADGKFTISVPANTGLPVHFSVDTGAVSSVYPTSYVVKYNNQYYDPTSVDVPIGVLNEASDILGTVTVYDYSGDSAPPPPYESNNNVLVGRVINGSTGAGVSGVSVKLGITPDPVYPATTGKAGYFAIDLGLETSLLSLYPSADVKFVVTLGSAASQFPSTAVINYGSSNYVPGSVISVTPEVVAGETNNMGTLKILSSGSSDGGGTGDGGGDTPPPPPIGY